MFGPCFWYAVLLCVISSVVAHLNEEERAGCFNFIVFLIPCDCKCSVSLPCGAVGLVCMCDCGIFTYFFV